MSVERRRLFELKRGLVDETDGDAAKPRAEKSTRLLSSLWQSGSFSASRAKESAAELAGWRKGKAEWRRARGLRRELLPRGRLGLCQHHSLLR